MTSMEITSQNLIDELRMAFPEIETRYQEEVLSWNGESPGNYNIFAFVFKPFIKEELAKENSSDFLGRFCEFLERVCSSDDKEAINVIWLKIFKLLLADPSTVKRLWPLLGSTTKANLADAALRWGQVQSVPAVGLIDGLKHWAGME
jgi:hypothetical protein